MRVIAIRETNKNEVNIFGYGEMIGKEPCPTLRNIPNPKIVLDNGDIVWGYQCWWADKARYENEELHGRRINIVPLDEWIKEENANV